MPRCPLRRTCARPSDGAGQDQHQKPKQSKAKQSKAKQSKAKQNKTKQNKTKQNNRSRSHALRGNAAGDAPRSARDARLESCALVTRSVTGCIPTRSVGTIRCTRRC
ncbi:hypothetical protein F7R14_19690 [Pseudomonas lini]|uniref:Uncharacterized protein n=1 Tax=Pseudomonas lini TaxID=163011 RepID=A0A7V7P2K3_9PSED|nr:hypothetical protein F7R14_19690 [Pseudomonas lini]